MITSAANPKVRWLRGLSERQGRRDARCYLIEGIHLIEEALQSGIQPRLILFSRPQLESSERGRDLLSVIAPFPAEEAAPDVLKRISETVTPQGIVAAVPLPEYIPLPAPDEPLLLVLDGIQDPGNLGTLLRTAEAAAIRSIFLTGGSADPYSPKVVRAAQGALFRLHLHVNVTWQVLLRDTGDRQILVAESGEGTPYDAIDWTQPATLVIGNEAHGPSDQARAHATQIITIPMPGRAESLNAAIAGSIIVFEALRQRRTKTTNNTRQRQ